MSNSFWSGSRACEDAGWEGWGCRKRQVWADPCHLRRSQSASFSSSLGSTSFLQESSPYGASHLWVCGGGVGDPLIAWGLWPLQSWAQGWGGWSVQGYSEGRWQDWDSHQASWAPTGVTFPAPESPRPLSHKLGQGATAYSSLTGTGKRALRRLAELGHRSSNGGTAGVWGHIMGWQGWLWGCCCCCCFFWFTLCSFACRFWKRIFTWLSVSPR